MLIERPVAPSSILDAPPPRFSSQGFVTRHWRGSSVARSLGLWALVSCTSFAGLDDHLPSAQSGVPMSAGGAGAGGAPGNASTGGGSSLPLGGLGMSGPVRTYPGEGPVEGVSGSDLGGVCANCDAGPINACRAAENCDAKPNDSCAAGESCDAGPSDSCPTGQTCDGDEEPTASCSDGIRNQDETGIDCGGSCRVCPSRCTRVVADSAADFSGAQGRASWFHGYYEEPNFLSANFIPLTDFHFEPLLNEEAWFSSTDTWLFMGRTRMHPNGRITSPPKRAIEQHPVRRWISPVSETLFLQGSLRLESPGSRGVIGRISVGDEEIWQRLVPLGENDPISFNVLASVHVGDAVNIELDPYLSDDGVDQSEFSVQLCR